MQFTEEQIKQLAPDDASVAAGKQLATPAKWVAKHRHEQALWGDCQGSGKVPYTTMIDLVNMAFKCSCPSRKFPCKHGLGLMFLYARTPDALTPSAELAPHVEEWIGRRNARQTAKESTESKPVDEKARQKRLDQRAQKVDAGVAEMSLWLRDQVRTGILAVPQNAYHFTDKIAARMVDAQASGLANRLKAMSGIDFYREGWQRQLLKHLSLNYLLATAYKNAAGLDENWQEEIRAMTGWNKTREEVLQQGETVSDEWLALAVTQETLDKLKAEKVWLIGKNTGRMAMILNFIAPGQLYQQGFLTGAAAEADLCYYPGIAPLRVVVREQRQRRERFLPKGFSSFDAMLEHTANSLSVNPFLTQIPVVLNEIALRNDQGRWFLADTAGKSLPLANPPEQCFRLLAGSLGVPFHGMGLFEDGQLQLLSFWDEHYFQTL